MNKISKFCIQDKVTTDANRGQSIIYGQTAVFAVYLYLSTKPWLYSYIEIANFVKKSSPPQSDKTAGGGGGFGDLHPLLISVRGRASGVSIFTSK
jgi:hypothetical protein